MADFDNSYLFKLFVKVPESITNFDGATTTANSYKIYFEEAKQLIWAKGKPYGISTEYKEKVDNLLTYVGSYTDTAYAGGSLYARIAAAVLATDQLRSYTYSHMNTLYSDKNTANSIQAIAYDVANMVVYDTLEIGADTSYIDRIKDVIDWFKNVSEEESGGAKLLSDVADLKTKVGEKTDTASVDGSAFAQIAYLTNQISEKNVGAHGEDKNTGLVYSYADANVVWTSSTNKLTTAVALAENSVQSIKDSKAENKLIGVTASGKAYTVAETSKLTDAVAKAESSAQSISIETAAAALLSVGYNSGAYTIGYTTVLGTAVANANSAIQTVNGETDNGALIEASTNGDTVTLKASKKLKDAIEAAEDSLSTITVGSYTLTRTGTHEVTKAQLKSDVLGDITGTTTYTDAASGIVVTISYSAGVITGVTLSGAALDTRVDSIEAFIQDYDPWEVQS